MTDPLFAASQHMSGMAGKSDGKMAMVMTVASVVLIGIMAAEKLQEIFGDKGYKDFQKHHQRYESHAERVRQTHGYGRDR